MDASTITFLALLVLAGIIAVPVLAIVAWRRSTACRAELGAVRQAQIALRDQVAALRADVQRLQASRAAPTPTAVWTPPAAPAAAPAKPQAAAPVARAPAIPPAVAPPPPAVPPSAAVPPPAPLPEAPPPAARITVPPPEAPRQVAIPPPPAPRPPAPQPAAPAPPPRAAIPPPPPSPSLLDRLQGFDWESFVGVKLFSWVAGIALLVAAVGFLSYSLQHGWLGAPIRMAIGLLTGTALLVACETRRAQRYAVTANALTAAGVATLFSTLFAAHALWHLVESPVITFALMALVAAVTVGLSIRRSSIFIALLGLLGGFATPILLSTGEDNPIGLFGYLLLLDLGLAWVAYRKRWPILAALSMAFTGVYQAGWVARFFDASRMPLAIGIFLLFPLVGFGALVLGSRRPAGERLPALFTRSAWLSALPPVLFALYAAITPACADHAGLLFGFLFVVALGLAIVAATMGPGWLHLAGAGTVLLVGVSYLGRSYQHADWPWALAFVALFVALYLAVPAVLHRLRRPPDAQARLAVYAAPLLLGAFPVLAAIEPATAGALPFFGALLGLAALLAAYAVAFEDGPVHFLAAGLVLLAEAVWSAQHLTPERLLPALLAYGGFGLFYLGVPLAAERLGRRLRPEGSGAVVLFATLGLLFFLTAGALAAVSLAALAVLVGVVNLGLLYEAAHGRCPLLAAAGIALSWLVMAVWWFTAPLVALLVPALAVVAGFALLALGGSAWAHRTAERAGRAEAATITGNGGALALAGHLFLLAVVAQPQLAARTWPWLAVLGVLDLAVGVAALATRRGWFHLAAVGASELVLLAWLGSADGRVPPPAWLPVGAALAVAAFALGWTVLAERRGARPEPFAIAAGVALLVGPWVVAVASGLAARAGHPWDGAALAPTAVAHAALLAGVLVLAWRARQHAWTVGAAVTIALAAAAWGSEHTTDWRGLLLVATPPYLLLLANPLLLRDRARNDRLPFVATLIGSAAFFLIARRPLLDAGFGAGIGLLPVTQALLLVPHLRLLLRMEPPSQRDMGRLALMAGAVLAFVTVAIPMQLEKQWITLGWALQAVALAWLYRRVPHKGLLAWLGALLAVVFLRLTVNWNVLSYHPRAAVPILNWYLYTWAVAAACFFAAAWLLRGQDDRIRPGWPRVAPLLPAGGAVLLFVLLNLEIADFWSTGDQVTLSIRQAGVAQNLSYTIGWALFAIGVLVAGVVARSRAARAASIGLLAVTVLKAFLYDLSELKDLYRVASFVGLAVCLVLVALVLQRFVLRRDRGDHVEPAP